MNMLTKQKTFPAVVTLLVLFLPATVIAQDHADAVLVTATEVRSSDVAPRVPAAGTVFSRNATQITAGIAGRLEWVAEPGDRIESGQPVARFDCELLGLQRDRQVAEAERAKINFDALRSEVGRLETLRDSSVIADIERERTQAQRDLAGSDLRIARITIRETESQLGHCVTRAPFSGVVTERLRLAGENVERSTVLAAMTDTDNLEVRASVPIRFLPRMRTGETAEIALGEVRLEGRIRKVVPAANAESQTFEVRLELPARAPELVAAGQLVSVSLPLHGHQALTVPRDSVVLREDGAFVMRIRGDETVERVAVEVSEARGERIAVSGELEAGDRIAVRGAEALQDGARVAIRSET